MYGRRRREYRPLVGESIAVGNFVDAASAKARQAFKVASAAASAYRLGKRLISSYSQKEKEMPPVKRKLFTPSKEVMVVGKSPRRSPGFMVRRKGGLMKKRPSQYGATNSKSKGFFGKSKKKKDTFDRYTKLGVVNCREEGGVIAGLPAGESVGMIHSTHGVYQLLNSACYALVKYIAAEMGRNVEYMTDNFMAGERSLLVRLIYCDNPIGATQTHDINITVTTTYQSLAESIATHIIAKVQTQARFFWKRVQVYESNVATTPAVAPIRLIDLDLARSTVEFFVKSSLKLQNRTVNTAGNDESDDVDNVPLYGKKYDIKGNYCVIREQYINPDIANLANTANYISQASAGLAEPVTRNLVKYSSATGKAHLDPGEIKTSVLNFKGRYDVNRLLSYLGSGSVASNILNIGKARFFIFEKMLKALATADVTSIKLAYETDIKTGCIFKAPKFTPTTYVFSSTPV